MDSNHFIPPSLRRPAKRWQAQTGFTLIEMMVVVAIVGVIAGIAVPGYQSMRAKMNLSGATGTLMTHLKQARHLAISEGRSVKVQLYPTYYEFDSGANKMRTVKMLSFGNVALSTTVVSNRTTFSSRGTAGTISVIISTGVYCKKITVNGIGRTYLARPPSPCP